MMDFVFLINTLAWPIAVAVSIWRICDVARAHFNAMAAQYQDASVSQAHATAAKALRAAEQAQKSLDTHREYATGELDQLKSSLLR